MPHPTTVFVRPAPGLQIRDPETGNYLPDAGQIVPRTPFWMRRLADGDVIETTSTAPAETEA